jgi:hypothetical protein
VFYAWIGYITQSVDVGHRLSFCVMCHQPFVDALIYKFGQHGLYVHGLAGTGSVGVLVVFVTDVTNDVGRWSPPGSVIGPVVVVRSWVVWLRIEYGLPSCCHVGRGLRDVFVKVGMGFWWEVLLVLVQCACRSVVVVPHHLIGGCKASCFHVSSHDVYRRPTRNAGCDESG